MDLLTAQLGIEKKLSEERVRENDSLRAKIETERFQLENSHQVEQGERRQVCPLKFSFKYRLF